MPNLNYLFFFLLPCLPLIHSCGSDVVAQSAPDPDFQPVEIEMLSSWSSGTEVPDWDAKKIREITNSSDMEQYWSDYSLEPEVPEVDFSQKVVLMYDRGPSRLSSDPVVSAERSAVYQTTRVLLEYEFCASVADSVPVHNTHERPLLIFSLPRGGDEYYADDFFVEETVTINDC